MSDFKFCCYLFYGFSLGRTVHKMISILTMYSYWRSVLRPSILHIAHLLSLLLAIYFMPGDLSIALNCQPPAWCQLLSFEHLFTLPLFIYFMAEPFVLPLSICCQILCFWTFWTCPSSQHLRPSTLSHINLLTFLLGAYFMARPEHGL